MTRILAAVVLGASMILTTAAAFADADREFGTDRQPSRNLVEQPVAITLDAPVVSGAPSEYIGPGYERHNSNNDRF